MKRTYKKQRNNDLNQHNGLYKYLNAENPYKRLPKVRLFLEIQIERFDFNFNLFHCLVINHTLITFRDFSDLIMFL